MNFGIVYSVTGNKKKYWEEAMISIKSLRRYNEGIPITIFSDIERSINESNVSVEIINATYSFVDKWIAIENSPYDKTLFLDTDTFVCDDLIIISEFLNNFDIVLCLDQSPFAKGTNLGKSFTKYHIPPLFPIFQGGVIGVCKNDRFKEYYNKWKDLFYEMGKSCDQVPLRISLYYDKNIKFGTLSPEFNMKLSGPVHFQVSPIIFHDRRSFKRFCQLEKKMKKNYGVRRVYLPRVGVLSNIRNMIRSRFVGYF